MSKRDRQLLQRLEISQRQTAAHLGISPAAISKGIHSESDYLGLDRLRTLIGSLEQTDPVRTKLLAEILRDEYGEHYDEEVLASEGSRIMYPDDPENFNFKEIWVVTSHPKELTSVSYLNKMRDAHYSRSEATLRYFLPRWGLAKRLLAIIESAKSKSRAKIEVYEVENLELSPHYVLFEPTTEDAYGLIRVSVYDFAKLPADEVAELAVSLELLVAESRATRVERSRE